jgi:hypothetical protein
VSTRIADFPDCTRSNDERIVKSPEILTGLGLGRRHGEVILEGALRDRWEVDDVRALNRRRDGLVDNRFSGRSYRAVDRRSGSQHRISEVESKARSPCVVNIVLTQLGAILRV